MGLYRLSLNRDRGGRVLQPALSDTDDLQNPHPGQPQMANNKQQTVDLLKSIETGDPKAFAVVNPNKYIQHNLAVADGPAGVTALLASLPKGTTKVNTVRVFQDGDFVFMHTDYDFFGPKVGFDIFRFEN